MNWLTDLAQILSLKLPISYVNGGLGTCVLVQRIGSELLSKAALYAETDEADPRNSRYRANEHYGWRESINTPTEL